MTYIYKRKSVQCRPIESTCRPTWRILVVFERNLITWGFFQIRLRYTMCSAWCSLVVFESISNTTMLHHNHIISFEVCNARLIFHTYLRIWKAPHHQQQPDHRMIVINVQQTFSLAAPNHFRSSNFIVLTKSHGNPDVVKIIDIAFDSEMHAWSSTS